MQKSIQQLMIASFVLALAAKANAVYVNPLGENSSSASLSLQGILDARGNTLINVYADQLNTGTASAWTSTGNSSVTVVDAVAGSVAVNVFGIYDIANPSQKAQIFLGGQGGDTASFTSPWAVFGFYLINGKYGNTWYSDPSLNGGQAHAVTYQGQGETLNLGSDPNNPVGSSLLGSNGYLMGWEDKDFATSDFDYNDIIVELNGVKTIPDASATVGLLAIAMMGLFFLQKAYHPTKAAVKSSRRSKPRVF